MSRIEPTRTQGKVKLTSTAYDDGTLKIKYCDKIYITDEDIMRANSFARACLVRSEVLYLKRHGWAKTKTSQDLLEKQIAVGKLAEIAVYQALFKFNYFITEPDFKSYSIEDKSYEKDLLLTTRDGEFRLHVKCNVSNRFTGHLISKTDPIIHAPTAQDYFVQCRWVEANKRVEIDGFLPTLKTIYGPPKVARLRPHKLVILHEDAYEAYMSMKYPTLDYIEGANHFEINTKIIAKQIKTDQIVSVESYFDLDDNEIHRLWYVHREVIDED